MNTWIFQAQQERYDLSTQLEEGLRLTWYATRYRSLMTKGDRVYLWQAGDPQIRGIYGEAHLAGEPYRQAEWEAEGVDLVVDRRIEPPVLARELERDRHLRDMLIMRAPIGTNFLLRTSEARALEAFVAEKTPAAKLAGSGGR